MRLARTVGIDGPLSPCGEVGSLCDPGEGFCSIEDLSPSPALRADLSR